MKYVFTASIILLISITARAEPGSSNDYGHSHKQSAKISSVGGPANSAGAKRIGVSLRDDMRFVFKPPLKRLTYGEVIEFVVSNDGLINHEFSIGSVQEHADHAKMMRSMPEMKHDEPNTVSLAPGERKRLTWRFNSNDLVVFACNIPGHFEAGMRYRLRPDK